MIPVYIYFLAPKILILRAWLVSTSLLCILHNVYVVILGCHATMLMAEMVVHRSKHMTGLEIQSDLILVMFFVSCLIGYLIQTKDKLLFHYNITLDLVGRLDSLICFEMVLPLVQGLFLLCSPVLDCQGCLAENLGVWRRTAQAQDYCD